MTGLAGATIPISSPFGGFPSLGRNYRGHMRTAVVERITDYYSMSGALRGPDGRFVRVDDLRERLALSSKAGVVQCKTAPRWSLTGTTHESTLSSAAA